MFLTCCHCSSPRLSLSSSFFFNDTATTEIYTLSLHDALPISTSHHISAKFPYPRNPLHVTICFRSEEHTSELQSRSDLVCRLLLEKKQKKLLDTLLNIKKKKKNNEKNNKNKI